MMMSKTLFLQQQAKSILANSNRSRLFRCSYSTLKTDSSQWLKPQGDQVKPSYVRGLIKNFRDTNEFPKTLEASEWMCEQKVLNVFPEDYAARFHLVETVLGLEEAEKLFESIPENMKDYSVYNTLLRSYTRSEETLDKADLGFLLNKPSPMISLYSHLNKQDMVEKLHSELKENNVKAKENFFLSLIKKTKPIEEKSKTSVDEKGTKLERDKIVTMAEAYVREGSIEKAIEMYGYVPGSKSLWDEYKKLGKLDDDGNRSVIQSLLKHADVQGAEKIYKEWILYGLRPDDMDMSIPDLLISRFLAEGDKSKVEEIRKKKIRFPKVEEIRKKNIRFLKQQRGTLKGISSRGNRICFGRYALQTLEPAWITSRQIEAGRRAMLRNVGRGGKIWVRIYPDKPVTGRPTEMRMGGGKGPLKYWVAVVKRGKILYEIGGVPENIARKAISIAASKMPIKTQFIISGYIGI